MTNKVNLSKLSVPDEGYSTKRVVRTKFDIYVLTNNIHDILFFFNIRKRVMNISIPLLTPMRNSFDKIIKYNIMTSLRVLIMNKTMIFIIPFFFFLIFNITLIVEMVRSIRLSCSIFFRAKCYDGSLFLYLETFDIHTDIF